MRKGGGKGDEERWTGGGGGQEEDGCPAHCPGVCQPCQRGDLHTVGLQCHTKTGMCVVSVLARVWKYSVCVHIVCVFACVRIVCVCLRVCILCVCLRYCVCVWPACVYVYVFSRANSLSLTHTQPHGSMSICVSDRLLGGKSNFM